MLDETVFPQRRIFVLVCLVACSADIHQICQILFVRIKV